MSQVPIHIISQILRHVTLAVTKAQENETEITEVIFFYFSIIIIIRGGKRQMKENELIPFQSEEELAGLFPGSGRTELNLLGLGHGYTAWRLITGLTRLPPTACQGRQVGKYISGRFPVVQRWNRKDLVRCATRRPCPQHFWSIRVLVTGFGILLVSAGRAQACPPSCSPLRQFGFSLLSH